MTTEKTNATAIGGSAFSEGLGPLPAPTCGAAIIVPGNGYTPAGAVWTAYSADDMRAYAAGAVAAERERCARICDGIGATYTGEARRLQGRHATRAAGQRDGANECAAEIRRA